MIPIISVTGTKGKTSTVRALDYVLQSTADNLLRVDTDGAWLNGKQQFTHNDSKEIWGLAPASAPGRFITLLAKKPNALAILETSLFCSKACGLGYSNHKVGVFTNVFEDHKGADNSLQTKEDIAVAKSFIFSKISNNGYAVYNADNLLVVSQLNRVPRKKTVTTIACSLTKSKTEADITLSVDKDNNILVDDLSNMKLGKITDYKMYVSGFSPSAYNILFVIGALIGYFDKSVPSKVITTLKNYQPTEENGRLVTYKTKDKYFIIFDYAHEKQSMIEVAKLAKRISPTGRVIGVLRLSPTRTDDLIKETAHSIVNCYDTFVIYDKIDGKTRKPNKKLNPFKPEVVGKISKIFVDALKNSGAKNVFMEIEENRALKKAASLATTGDVIIYVQGNDSETSLKYLRETFNNLQRIQS